jgi:predicted regulator of Ras-like GTPase activity (Roadblock/LC7/MglB family)
MFQDLLTNLLTRVEGAERVILAGIDGVLLEASPRDPAEHAERLAAEYAAVARAAQRASATLESTNLASLVLTTSRSKLVVQMITPEYFLLVCLSPGGYAGRARFEIARARDLFERELVF